MAICCKNHWRDADTCEYYYQECRSSRFWVGDVTCVGSMNYSKGCCMRRESDLALYNFRSSFFCQVEQCSFLLMLGLIITLWCNDGCITWHPGATDLSFSSLSSVQVESAYCELMNKFMSLSIKFHTKYLQSLCLHYLAVLCPISTSFPVCWGIFSDLCMRKIFSILFSSLKQD